MHAYVFILFSEDSHDSKEMVLQGPHQLSGVVVIGSFYEPEVGPSVAER